jgi:branched-chain amino acid transport system permease protein
MSVGLALIFGVMELVNFAHGEFYMLGGYATYFIITLTGLNPIPSAIATFALLFFVGCLVETSVIRPIRGTREAHDNLFLATFGLSVLLQNLVLIVWGANYYGMPSFFKGGFAFLGTFISFERLSVVIVSIASVMTLWFLLEKTKIGTAIRAVSQNKEAASLVGININRIYLVAFGLSTALAGLAGAMLSPLLLIYPTVGSGIVFKAFAVVTLAGFGSIKGAIFSSYILGIAEAITVTLFGAIYRDAVAFLILVIILIVRPSGLFGLKTR